MFKVQGSRGITLIELVVTLSIITILLSLAAIAFNNYQVNYNVEGEIKTLYSDIQGARMHAMNENRPYVFKFTSVRSYVAAVDSNADEDYNAGDIKVDKYSKDSLKYQVSMNFPGKRITLNSRGMIILNGSDRIDNGSVWIDKENSAEYDCIAISNTRIKMGKWDGARCKIKRY